MNQSANSLAISELARRILRSTGCIISHPSYLEDEMKTFSTELSDLAPTMIFGMQNNLHISECIKITFEKTSKGGIISKECPENLDDVWIQGDYKYWPRLKKNILDLAEAGYPGCIGCAGPAAELPWDEISSRSKIT
ncbi:MAG: hypothetical protein CXT72_00500 [Methanobacteriota archaeon]|nr:MAG: hypothetical protein CXT72_00500 [Euryarchaeota archaeon]HIE63978.1 hypothetical protein [Candidatus Poseidoniales archaeon]